MAAGKMIMEVWFVRVAGLNYMKIDNYSIVTIVILQDMKTKFTS